MALRFFEKGKERQWHLEIIYAEDQRSIAALLG
jgi:predicted N-formylglutamate amidohydrolase